MSTPGNPTLGLIGRFFSSFKEELIARIEKDGRVKEKNADAMYLDLCDLVERKFNRKNSK